MNKRNEAIVNHAQGCADDMIGYIDSTDLSDEAKNRVGLTIAMLGTACLGRPVKEIDVLMNTIEQFVAHYRDAQQTVLKR